MYSFIYFRLGNYLQVGLTYSQTEIVFQWSSTDPWIFIWVGLFWLFASFNYTVVDFAVLFSNLLSCDII